MARFYKNKGLAPGTPVFIGNHKTDEILIRLIEYNPDSLNEEVLPDLNKLPAFNDNNNVKWLNIDGLEDIEHFINIGSIFDIHSLVIEDIVNTGQRPKMDEYDESIFIVLKMLYWDDAQQKIIAEQLSMILMPGILLTFQERKGDVFEPVRERIRRQKGRIRTAGSDYLAYALLDTIVDNYIYLIARLGEEIEDLESDILENPEQHMLDRINIFKRELKYVRKSIRPAKELVLKLTRSESELISDSLHPFLKDLEDLTTQANEMVETYTDLLADYLNIYNTGISNRMNDIMKVLTIFAAIFIPLTFIAGIYGTNFDYLPELHFKYSYFVLWGVMIAIAAGMLVYFKRKKWL